VRISSNYERDQMPYMATAKQIILGRVAGSNR
jgi:hypothetical protein